MFEAENAFIEINPNDNPIKFSIVIRKYLNMQTKTQSMLVKGAIQIMKYA